MAKTGADHRLEGSFKWVNNNARSFQLGTPWREGRTGALAIILGDDKWDVSTHKGRGSARVL